MGSLIVREVKGGETDTIATLHATSWRSAYRGLLSDEYLDNDLEGERKRYWSQKMPTIFGKEFVLVAEQDNEIVGFVAVLDKPDAGFDALVDNLHVRPDLKGRGIGGLLLKAVADRLLSTGRSSYYLWVLKGNSAAAKFYLAQNGRQLDTMTHDFGGKTVEAIRFAWDRLV